MLDEIKINFAIDCFNSKKIALLENERQIILDVIQDHLAKTGEQDFWAILKHDDDYLISNTGKIHSRYRRLLKKVNEFGFVKIKTKFLDIRSLLAHNFFGYRMSIYSPVRINLDNGFNLDNIKYVLNQDKELYEPIEYNEPHSRKHILHQDNDIIVYGPNYRPDGRKQVGIIDKHTNKYTFVLYSKYVYESTTGEKVPPSMTIDHIDQDTTNDDFSNLRIISRSDNAKRSVIRLEAKEFTCPLCGKKFILEGRKLNDVYNSRIVKNVKSGPYCSKSCAGKASHIKNMPLLEFEKTHYRIADIK